MSELGDRVARLAELQQRRSGVDRRYRLSECRSIDQRRAMFARLQADDPQLVGVLRAFADCFGRGAVATIDVVDGGSTHDVGGVEPLPVVDVVGVDGRRCCYWVRSDEGGDGRG